MTPSQKFRSRLGRTAGFAALLIAAPLVLGACGSDSSNSSDSGSSSQTEDTAIAKLVPSPVKDRGTLRVAVPDGSAPLASVSRNQSILNIRIFV